MAKQKFSAIQQQEVTIQALDRLFPQFVFALVSSLLTFISSSSCMCLCSLMLFFHF